MFHHLGRNMLWPNFCMELKPYEMPKWRLQTDQFHDVIFGIHSSERLGKSRFLHGFPYLWPMKKVVALGWTHLYSYFYPNPMTLMTVRLLVTSRHWLNKSTDSTIQQKLNHVRNSFGEIPAVQGQFPPKHGGNSLISGQMFPLGGELVNNHQSSQYYKGYINDPNSLTWIEPFWGWFPLLITHDSRVPSPWRRLDVPGPLAFSPSVTDWSPHQLHSFDHQTGEFKRRRHWEIGMY